MGIRALQNRACWQRSGIGVVAALLVSVWSVPRARADEPRKLSEPAVLREPTEIVQVADAFDGDDLFDLHLSLGYQHSWKNAKIYRETAIAQNGLSAGGYTASNMSVASYSQSTSHLNTRADIGIYKDIAVVIRMPIVLSDDRELKSDGGGVPSTVLAGVPGEVLFNLPFKAPSRSGIEYLALGMDFGLMNQARNPTKPTWLIGGEVRLDVSEPMHACNDDPVGLNQTADTQVRCAYPHDIDRDSLANEPEFRDAETGVQLDEGPSGQRKPGVSRGTTGLAFHTFLSRRVKYIEPYGGFDILVEFPNSSSDYQQTDLRGSLVNHPPLRGTMTVGIAVMPWEIRDAFQRLTIDGRFTGTYVSEGRDYNELFDALGSSDARSLRSPNFSEYKANTTPSADRFPSVVDPNSQKVYYTGLADVQQHGEYTFQLSATYQAGEYVKFNLGGSYTLVQGHFITFDQACNPNFDGDDAQAGPCHSTTETGTEATGIPNPNYRKPINDPGRRFKVDDVNGLDAWISATVMF